MLILLQSSRDFESQVNMCGSCPVVIIVVIKGMIIVCRKTKYRATLVSRDGRGKDGHGGLGER